MAWLNPVIAFNNINCMSFKNSELSNISDTLYSSSAFDTSSGDVIHVDANTTKSISDEHIEFRIDNTYAGGSLSYISLWVDGTNVNYVYSGVLITDFKIVIAINESTSGSSYIGIYSTQYNQIQIKYFNSNISAYLQDYLQPPVVPVTSNGGGATHIAKVTGHLSALSSNLSDILIVAGGGGGGMIIDSVAYDGADAGGISGSGNNSANQTTGYAFGQGESADDVSGGGGGLYGGYKGTR